MQEDTLLVCKKSTLVCRKSRKRIKNNIVYYCYVSLGYLHTHSIIIDASQICVFNNSQTGILSSKCHIQRSHIQAVQITYYYLTILFELFHTLFLYFLFIFHHLLVRHYIELYKQHAWYHGGNENKYSNNLLLLKYLHYHNHFQRLLPTLCIRKQIFLLPLL